MSDLAALPARAAERWPGRNVVVLDETASTNDEAKAHVRAGAAAGLTIVADRQTGGRGRMGRVWHSPAGAGLYLSTVVTAPPIATRVPIACAVACAAALGTWVPELRVKWPNDVLARDGRKLAGILCEGVAGMIVVGVGINVAHEGFEGALHESAISLRMLGAGVDRADVALALVGALDEWLPRAAAEWEDVRAAWLRVSATVGRVVDTPDATGIAVDLADDGALIVEAEGVRRRVVTP